MKYALFIANFGYCGDARVLAEIAHQTEDAGWDGCFISDHVRWPIAHFPDVEPIADPWVALTAMAMRTERIRLGTMVTPLPRRRPTKLAREAATLDQLSGGRLILGAGSGIWPDEFGAFGDESDSKIRAAMLEEGLALLARLWSGKPVDHKGAHYQVATTAFAPPLQQPRIPIWVAASWPIQKMLRRAAQWDGVFPLRHNDPWAHLTPAEIREVATSIAQARASSGPFEIACQGETRGNGTDEEAARIAAYEAAGGTWWLEWRSPWETTLDELLARVCKGPPRA